MPIFRWDIDKTYLETDFQSLSGLWRAATESAQEKISVSGVVPLVQSLNTVADSKLIFLSGSPRQMKRVLMKKFRLDGIQVDKIILKDSLGALSKGRFSEVTGQFGHKLSSLLRHRIQVQDESCAQVEYLFGDDVEQDALIYATYALLLHQELTWPSLKIIAQKADAYSDVIERLGRQFSQIGPGRVGRAFIRLTQHQIPPWMQQLAPLVVPVHCWSQAAMVLALEGVLSWSNVQSVFHEEGMNIWDQSNLVQDLQRRQLIGREDATHLYEQIGRANYVFPLEIKALRILDTDLAEMFERVS